MFYEVRLMSCIEHKYQLIEFIYGDSVFYDENCFLCFYGICFLLFNAIVKRLIEIGH